MSDKQIIPYGRQNITPEDIQEVSRVLQSDYLTQGPEIPRFEQAFADYVGAKYAVAVSNGTAALHLCAMALNAGPGQRVITTPITFAASGNCVRYCGGEVDFADIDPDTYLLDINAVRRKLEAAPKGTYAGIILVDFAGRAVNLEAFRNLADEHGLWIIEDACHAPGGFFVDSSGAEQRCGNGAFADLAIFSFHPVKHIAAGEGGMITTNNPALYERLLVLRTHGITKQFDAFTQSMGFAAGLDGPLRDGTIPLSPAPDSAPGWYMEMHELGYNYRLTDFQAALGYSQLQRADSGLARRRILADRYAQAFNGNPYALGQSGSVPGHAYHLFILETPRRLELYNHLRTLGIYAQVHYIPLHLMPYYQNLDFKQGDFPHAEAYYRGCLSLPMYPTLTDEQQELVIDSIERFFD